MALFRMNPQYGMGGETLDISLMWVDNLNPNAGGTTVGTANRQILSSALTVSGSAGLGGATIAKLGQDANLKPTRFAQPFTVFAAPSGASAGAATNVSPLPIGLSNTTGIAGEYVVNLQGFPADIIAVAACYTPNVRGLPGAGTLDAFVSAVDNTNKLIYVQLYNTITAASLSAPVTAQAQWGTATAMITLTVTMIDSNMAP